MATRPTPDTFLAKEKCCMNDPLKHPVETPAAWLRYAESD
jgi:hypothetical protein